MNNAALSPPDSPVLDLLRTRRSVPPQWLGPPGPSAAEIEAMLAIASRVPDHGKLAPWRFIVLEGEGQTRIGAVVEAAYRADNPGADAAALTVEAGRLAQAPLVVGVVSRAAPHVKIPDWEQVLSAGAACMNLILAAHALGYAASWLTGWIAYDRRILDALGLEPEERLAGFIHIGRPQQTPTDRPRPALADIVTRF